MRIIIVLFLMLLSATVFSQTPLFEIETGYYSYSSSFSPSPGNNITSEISQYPMYANIIMGVGYKRFKFVQTVENFFGYKYGFSLSPYQIRYVTGLSYEYKKMTISFEHMCFHPVIASARVDDIKFFAGYDKITIKYKIL